MRQSSTTHERTTVNTDEYASPGVSDTRRWRLRGVAIALCTMLFTFAGPHPQAHAGTMPHTPPAPDYVDSHAWLSRSIVPVHGVAVFFIHPTSYLAHTIANARFDQGGRTARLNKAAMRYQAAVFAHCCDIWAPQYRQASIKAVVTDTQAAHAVDNIAYKDIARAFGYFVADLHGRPFILAGHSQGSVLALRLLQRRIMGTPLQRRMIAAYLPGLALPKAIAASGLHVCSSATATRCVVTWNTVHAGFKDRRLRRHALIWWNGHYRPLSNRPLVCVNPVDWRIGGHVNKAPWRPLSVYVTRRGRPRSAPVAALASATCETDGLLGITIKPQYRYRFTDVLSLTGVYHDFDYSLFFASIVHNVNQRIQSFALSR